MKISRDSFIVIFIVVFIAAVLLITNCWADSETAEAWVICHPASYVNARMKPSGRSESIGMLEAGYLVHLDGKVKKGFAHCVDMALESKEGWLSAGYLVFDEPLWLNGAWYRVDAGGRVAARKCVDGKRLNWLKDGTRLQVFWLSNDWCVTTRGFVRTEYLKEDP